MMLSASRIRFSSPRVPTFSVAFLNRHFPVRHLQSKTWGTKSTLSYVDSDHEMTETRKLTRSAIQGCSHTELKVTQVTWRDYSSSGTVVFNSVHPWSGQYLDSLESTHRTLALVFPTLPSHFVYCNQLLLPQFDSDQSLRCRMSCTPLFFWKDMTQLKVQQRRETRSENLLYV